MVNQRTAGRPSGPRLPQPRHRSRFRVWLGTKPAVDLTYRILVGVIGTLVLGAGVAMIPYPGPGWLVVFAGLAILGTEFEWARKLLHAGRRRYDQWTAWMRSQPLGVRLLLLGFTGVVVIITLYLINAFGLVARVLGFDAPWLQGPIG